MERIVVEGAARKNCCRRKGRVQLPHDAGELQGGAGRFPEAKAVPALTLELVSGSRIEVNHPEALTLYDELVMCVSTSTGRSVFEYAGVVRFIEGTGLS
jgi:hypothetical protein